MDRKNLPETTHTVLVCHSNRNLVRVAMLNASRHGIHVILARDGKDLLVKSRSEVRPDAILLSKDLKNPSTDEIVKQLNADPMLRGVPVIVLNGLLGNIGDLLKSYKGLPWKLKV